MPKQIKSVLMNKVGISTFWLRLRQLLFHKNNKMMLHEISQTILHTMTSFIVIQTVHMLILNYKFVIH